MVTLRSRIFLIVLVGAVLPLAILGFWLAGTAQRSGEMLLRERLQSSLGQVIEGVGLRWLAVRSELLRLAEHPEVQMALRETDSRPETPSAASPSPSTPSHAPREGTDFPPGLRDLLSHLQTMVDEVRILDSEGNLLWTASSGSGAPLPLYAAATRPLPIQLGIFHLGTGRRLGTLDVDLRLSTLLTGSAVWGGVAGSVLGTFEAGTGTSLLPLSVDPLLLERDQFQWRDETWLSVHRRLEEPPLELVLAAPVTPFVEPFRESARRNLWILGGVTLLVLALATVLTRGTTRDLSRLADAAEAVAQGDLHREVETGGPGEVGRVGRAFNAMTESLRATLQELSEGRALAAVGEFAASLAHEIRNPLTSIRYDLQRMEEKLPDDEETRELMARTLRKTDALNRSVSGALQLARSGSVSLKPLDLRGPLRAAVQMAFPTFQERGGTLDVTGTEGEPIEVRGDVSALERLFLNLLLNAAQALEPGGVARLEVESGQDAVRVIIQDNGKGIEAENLTLVFDPFFSTRSEGTGLGLPIARRIAQAHRGDLSVESAPGEGTTATVRLPL